MGGLHVIGTERHEARRIDNQLRGRCGRQGDPGSSRFYLSLEDDLMRIFAGDWVKKVLQTMGMKKGEAIESKMVSRRIEGAQKKVEERNFEVRKNLLEYDEVMDEQRKRVYGYRDKILQGANCKVLILDMIRGQIDDHLDEYLDPDYGPASFCKWAGTQLAMADELPPKEFRDVDLETATRLAKEEAERSIESFLHEELDQSLPTDVDDPSEWNWESVAKMANKRWGLSLNARELKRVGRDDLSEFLIEKAEAAIEAVDLNEGAKFLDADFGLLSASAWLKYKFDLDVPVRELRELERAEVKRHVLEQAEAAYEEKETEYPVMAGLYHFTTRDARGHKRYDREMLVDWARERFHVELTVDDLRNKQQEDIEAILLEKSRHRQQEANAALAEAHRRVAKLFGGSPPAETEAPVASLSTNGAIESLRTWMESDFDAKVDAEELGNLPYDRLRDRVISAVEEHYRPEIRLMERQLLLQILDNSWKDHLLAMDHLRSAIGLVGYAQRDPKVEYKRGGRDAFNAMWKSVGEQTTDLIFRMEQLDVDFVGSTWAEAEAVHAEAAGVSEMSDGGVFDNSGGDRKPEPIRNRMERVPRNAPCPCGSGKKYKQCCGRKAAGVA